jgi:hypothetical protein
VTAARTLSASMLRDLADSMGSLDVVRVTMADRVMTNFLRHRADLITGLRKPRRTP